MNDIISDLQDMRYLNWTRTRKSSGTAGSFLKAYDDSGKKKKYYKLSDYDPVNGIIGHECVNEIIVQRLLNLLGFAHLDYTLIHGTVRIDDKEYETYLCESEDYKNPGERKISLEDYYAMEKENDETPFDFCVRKGWEKYVYEMFLTDYLVLNRDRHGANIEVLRDPKLKKDRLSPLFDHGLSFVCRCHTSEELKKFDVMEDKRVQSFVGSSSTLMNIKMIPKDYLNILPELNTKDIKKIFEGLDTVIGAEYISKMNEMIKKRWCSLDNI